MRGCAWPRMVVPVVAKLSLAVRNYAWLCLYVPESLSDLAWIFMTMPSCTWQSLTLHGEAWLCPFATGRVRSCLVVLGYIQNKEQPERNEMEADGRSGD